MSECLPVLDSGIESYIRRISQYPLLTPEEELEHAVSFKERNDTAAAYALITANLRFVVKIAFSYRGYCVPLEDLIQEGNLGLMQALRKFDPQQGVRFISYAVYWVRAAIHDLVMRTSSLVKIGTTALQKKLFWRLSGARSRLLALTGAAGNEELAAELDAPVEAVAEMNARLSWNEEQALPDGQQGAGWLEQLRDPRPDAEESLAAAEVTVLTRKAVDCAMATLTERQREVAELRLMSDAPLTLQEIADRFGVSRERIRQIETDTINKLKKNLELSLLQEIHTS